MWILTLRGLLAHKARLALTGLAVVLGTAFVAGALVFADTLEQGFEELFTSIVGTADVIVRPAGAEDDGAAGGFGAGPPPSLAPEVLDEVLALDDVARAEGEIAGVAVLIGDDGTPIGEFGPPTLAGSAFEDDTLDPAELRTGRWPATEGEIAIDAGTATAQGWETGDDVQLVIDGPVEDAEVVGVFGLGELDNLAGASVVILDRDTAAARLGTDGELSRIYVVGDDGTDAQGLADSLTTTLGGDVEAVTAAEVAEEQQAVLGPFIDVFSNILLAFALVALLVGAFLIFNTFTIVLAGRMRELALLRAIGAGRSQLLRSVLGEAALVGLLGGATGALLGLGVARGLQALLATVGVTLPGDQLVVSPRTVLVAVTVGLVVTVLAAIVPARRAVQVPPVAALTQIALAAPSSDPRIRTVVGTVLLLGGVVGLTAGIVTDAATIVLAVAAVVVVLGVAALAAAVVPPLAWAVGAPLRRLGVSGELAQANARRTPRRTAATASALMIGLGLVSFVAILTASVDATVRSAIDRSFLVDAVVQASGASGIPDSAIDAIAGVDEVATVAPVGAAQLEVAGRDRFVGVMDATDVVATLDLEVVEGDVDDLPGGLLVAESAARDAGVGAGDRVEVMLPDGATEVPVAAVIVGSGLDTAFVLDAAAATAGGADPLTFNAYVRFADDADPERALSDVETALGDHPQVTVYDQAGLAEAVSDQLDQLFGIVLALLALSVLVALLGIVNTLALSVVERTRELGLLRAVGMTRGQVRRMVRGEALVVAVLGAALGLLVGVPLGIAFVQVDRFDLDVLAVPVGQLGLGALVAAIAGLVAGVLPARRAARLDVLEALSAE